MNPSWAWPRTQSHVVIRRRPSGRATGLLEKNSTKEKAALSREGIISQNWERGISQKLSLLPLSGPLPPSSSSCPALHFGPICRSEKSPREWSTNKQPLSGSWKRCVRTTWDTPGIWRKSTIVGRTQSQWNHVLPSGWHRLVGPEMQGSQTHLGIWIFEIFTVHC